MGASNGQSEQREPRGVEVLAGNDDQRSFPDGNTWEHRGDPGGEQRLVILDVDGQPIAEFKTWNGVSYMGPRRAVGFTG